MTYQTQENWQQLMTYLPKEYRFTKDYHPKEEWWSWRGHEVHLDTFRDERAEAKLICFHGVGTNGRQISLVTGGPQSKRGYETIMIDMPTYGVTKVKNRKAVTYDDWVDLACDYINYELARDSRPIFLYGLSAGGMETYHVAAKSKKVSGIIGMTFLDQRIAQVKQDTAYNATMGRFGVPMNTLLRKIGFGKLTMPMRYASKMSALVNDSGALELMLSDKTSAGNSASINFLDTYMNYTPAVEPEDFSVCPILLTQPECDRWTPLELSQPTLEKIQKVKVKTVILPNGGHYPIEKSALDVMNQAIDDFISEQLPQDKSHLR